MRWKTTVVLLLATLGIGAYVSLYEIRRPLPEERERLAKQVLDVPQEAVTQLVLELPRVKLTLTRAGAAWWIEPNRLRADPDRVDRILSAVASLTAERVLQAGPAGRLEGRDYSLQPAVGTLALFSHGTPATLLIGEATPVAGNRYVQVAGRPDIYIVPSDFFEQADQPFDLYRDAKLLRFDQWAAEELTVRTGDATVTLTHNEQGWRLSAVPSGTGQAGLTRPIEDRAESTEVEALLTTIADVDIARFLEDVPPVDRSAEWGFDPPEAELTIRMRPSPGTPSTSGVGEEVPRPKAEGGGEAASSVTVLFGKALASDPSLRYAKRSDEPPLYAVSASALKPLLKAPDALRATQCLEGSPDQMTKVSVEREGKTWTIATTSGTDNEPVEWKEEGEEAPALERSRVEAFLQQVSALRVTRFVEDPAPDPARYGLDRPAGTISVWVADHAEPQRLVIGAALEGSTARYGRLEAREAIAELPETVLELLSWSPDQLRAQH